jgi:hypothetical protein
MEALAFKVVVGKFLTAISPIPPLLIGIAGAYFLWGVVVFISAADDESKRKEGKANIGWGLIALFVTVAVWALVAVVLNTFGLAEGTINDIGPLF